MTLIQLFVWCVVALVTLIASIVWLLRRLKVRSFAWSFALAYIVLLGLVFLLYYPMRGQGQAGLIWTIPMVLALPSSLLIPPGSDLSFTLFLAACGSAQYFVIGWIIDRIIRMRARRGVRANGDTR